jgi:acetylglutamate kinase
LIPKIDTANYANYKAQGHIDGGMIVKLDNCFEALNGGVSSVILSDMPNLLAYMQGNQASVTRVVL